MTLIKSISGIRGTIGGMPGENLTPIDIVKFTAAYGSWLLQNGAPKKIVIGRDARVSGAMVSDLISSTLMGLGMNVVDLELSTTPTVEMAVAHLNAGGGIIVTASHNPGQWNALKLLNAKGEFISAHDGSEILNLAEKANFEFEKAAKIGKKLNTDYGIDDHIQAIINLPLVNAEAIREAKLKLVVDAVNSTGGIAVPRLLKALGVDVVEEMYCTPNGHFPHNPEPLPENIAEICQEIENGDFDLGIVVDPDVDRLALICEDGNPFGEEYTLVAVADYVLSQKKGSTVSNLSSTRALRDVTEKHNCEYHSSAVGEVNVVEKMKAVNAVIGGEGNGGIIYPELHYGRDALVGIALFLTHLVATGKTASKIRAGYPNYIISKNKIELSPELNVDRVLGSIQARYQSNPINTIDGVKIEFDKEWVHLRKSNTEPIIRIYAESDSEAKANHLAHKIIEDIKEIMHEKVN